MTVVHRICPALHVETPRGPGRALFLIDYGPSINTIWLVRLDATGDVLHVDSAEVRVHPDPAWGLPPVAPFAGRVIPPPA